MIQNERVELNKKNIDPNDYDIVDVEVHVESKKLFELFEIYYQYFTGEYLSFVSSLFKIIDQVEEIESIKSVTSLASESIYNSLIKKSNLKKNDYVRLSKITLLDHIKDITILIVKDIEDREGDREALTESESQHLLLLALLHDIGKIMPLMSLYGIQKTEGTHEVRSRIFMDMIIEGGSYSETLLHPLKRIAKNLLNMEKGETNGTISRFHEYDKRARLVELLRLKDEDQNK